MKILQILETMIAAKGMEVLLLGKEVSTPHGTRLGVVVEIKRELSYNKIWAVVNNLGQEGILPIEQIAGVTDKIILSDNLLFTSLAVNRN